MQRIITKAGTLCGLVLVILGCFGWALLGLNGSWAATGQVPAGQSAVVIGPSLASVLGPRITIQAQAEGGAGPQVFIGRARPDDAAALVGSLPRAEITGLASARALDITPKTPATVTPGPAPTSAATPPTAGSAPPSLPPATAVLGPKLSAADIWRTQMTGSATVQSSLRASAGGESVVIASTDGKPLPAMRIRVVWSNPWWLLIPLVLALAGFILLTVTVQPLRQLATRGQAKARRDGLRSTARRTAEVTAQRGRREAERTIASAQRTRRGARRAQSEPGEVVAVSSSEVTAELDLPTLPPEPASEPDYLTGPLPTIGEYPSFSDPQQVVDYAPPPAVIEHPMTTLPLFTAPPPPGHDSSEVDALTDDQPQEPWTEPPLTRSQAAARRRSQSRWRR